MSSPSPDDRDPVDVLAEEFAERLRRGEYPSVSDYAAGHPALAEQLREVLPAVAQMEQLKRFRQTNTPSAEESLPGRFGDFRIVKELGRGGMGLVFEAVQESLGRRVALKVLAHHAQLDPNRRGRFVREAQAAARLHHTNIVPVFGVGEQDGLPYYVMQLIPGCGLNEVIARWRIARAEAADPAPSTVAFREADTFPEKPSEPEVPAPPPAVLPRVGDWAFVAEIGVQAAEALHYAHEQGVLHRDVKPANLLLDERGRVWVVDFGLAKLLDSEGLTNTGDIVGTLQYLAPECLHGGADTRSDVYGLGATLYELLTLDRPFEADTPAKLIKLLTDTDPPHPRSLNPAIPRDLETIVLTAIAREPARRYATAQELADDLRAFLDDRPIKARRTTMLGRGWRWCKRNPAVATLAASTVLALGLAAGAGWAGYVNTREALAAEAKQRKDAEDASAKLEANLNLSLEAFERVFEAAGGSGNRTRFGPMVLVVGGLGVPGVPGGPGDRGSKDFPGPKDWGPKDRGPKDGGPGGIPGLQEAGEQAAVLEAVLGFYDRFAEQNATNPKLQFQAAKAHRRIGDVHLWFGRADKAAASFARAARLFEELFAQYPDDETVRFELMMALGHAPDPVPERNLERAVELGRGLTGDPARRFPVGGIMLRLAWAREQAGKKELAAATYREVIAHQTPRSPEEWRPEPAVFEQAVARNRLAALLTESNRLAESRRLLEDSLVDVRPLTTGMGPQAFTAWQMMATTNRQLAGVLDRLNEPDAAEKARQAAETWGQPPSFVPGGGKGFGGPFPKGEPKGPPKK